jgi:hypothetical protein
MVWILSPFFAPPGQTLKSPPLLSLPAKRRYFPLVYKNRAKIKGVGERPERKAFSRKAHMTIPQDARMPETASHWRVEGTRDQWNLTASRGARRNMIKRRTE